MYKVMRAMRCWRTLSEADRQRGQARQGEDLQGIGNLTAQARGEVKGTVPVILLPSVDLGKPWSCRAAADEQEAAHELFGPRQPRRGSGDR